MVQWFALLRNNEVSGSNSEVSSNENRLFINLKFKGKKIIIIIIIIIIKTSIPVFYNFPVGNKSKCRRSNKLVTAANASEKSTGNHSRYYSPEITINHGIATNL